MADVEDRSRGLTEAERERLAQLKAASTLADLVALTGADDEHDAYVRAKEEWASLRERDPNAAPERDGLPGARVRVDDVTFWVHGITHADTDAERRTVRRHVREYLDRGAAVYCEQGIRQMYLSDVEDVCEVDDYRWAMQACTTDNPGADRAGEESPFDGVVEDFEEFRSTVREAAFSLAESGGDAFGERVRHTIGDVASTVLTSHEALGTADDFTSHDLSRRAAEDPTLLVDLQRYYERSFLPQPLEREWLRRHDPDLELATHARNERMADYVVYHAGETAEVHLIAGAAHVPGVRYYLERHRDGQRDVAGFQPC